MREIIFMGTPAFSVRPLEALIQSSDYHVAAVVTQPDRLVGRKKQVHASPVKETALAHDIPVYQPERLKDDERVQALAESGVDLIVTAAYGQFLPTRLFEAPAFGTVNLHASLLPKYRGGAPVHYAIWNGEKETGITLMQVAKKMDAGDILAQQALAIGPDDTVSVLFDRLSVLAADVLMDNLPKLFDGALTATPQDAAQVTFAPNITRQQEQIDWRESAQRIHDQIRAFNSWPGAYTLADGTRYKLWMSEVAPETTDAAPGTVVQVQAKPPRFMVACGDGSTLALTEIQPAGKKAMPIASFINGGSGGLDVGDRFESPQNA